MISLTHVCQAWREVFTARSSLWTDLHCVDTDKTRIYLERSSSSPIKLSLDRDGNLSPNDPFFQTIPHAIGRLKSLTIQGTPENLQDITAHLSHPAPLLERLSIDGGSEHGSQRNPVLATTLFNGDLSSLQALRLRSVRTELPWRNMANLTSFTLALTSPVSAAQLLDFFENAPHLREVELHSTTPTSGAQKGRLVSLANLKTMHIAGGGPPSVLLNHLLIPVGAKLTTQGEMRNSLIEDHLPKCLDNLRNFSNFTTIHLYAREHPRMEFSGPNGQVSILSITSGVDKTRLVLDSLAKFDTSKTEHLKIDCSSPPTSDPAYQALLPMKHLRTITLYWYKSPHLFIDALHPCADPSQVMVCPDLEEVVLMPPFDREIFHLGPFIAIAAARASRGAKLKHVSIVTWHGYSHAEADVLELKKHALHVEC